MKVLITGGTGLVGRELSMKLRDKGYDVAILSRSKKKNTEFQTYLWDPSRNSVDREAIQTSDIVVHLAGANLSEKRWSEKQKKLIIDSRVETAKLLFNQFKKTKHRLKAFISASAVNYYGVLTSEKIFSENDPPASDFIGETCILWEQSANRFKHLKKRVVILRTATVLSQRGGALPKMSKPVKLGAGAPVGSGKQYMPWIHIDDICKIYIKAIEDTKMKGAYNAAAPEQVTNEYFMKTLARVLGKPFLAPRVPAFVLKTLYGQMAELILKGSRVSTKKIESAGYEFQITGLEDALKDLIKTGK